MDNAETLACDVLRRITVFRVGDGTWEVSRESAEGVASPHMMILTCDDTTVIRGVGRNASVFAMLLESTSNVFGVKLAAMAKRLAKARAERMNGLQWIMFTRGAEA